MQTFLIIVGVIFGLCFFGVVLVYYKLKSLAARALLFFARKGVEGLKESAAADYVSQEIRDQVNDVEARLQKVPEPGFFSTSDVFSTVPGLMKEMGELNGKLEQLKKDHAPQVIDVPAQVVASLPAAELLALPAPAPSAGKVDETLAAFRAEFIKPNSGVVDAWTSGQDANTVIVYQLSTTVADTNVMPNVPASYGDLPTVITWFAREQQAAK